MRDHVLFDGDCGICTWAAERGRAFDRAGRWTIVPWQDVPPEALARAGLTAEACARSLHVVTRTGRIRRGAFAVNAFLASRRPGAVMVALLYALPPLLLLESVAYRLVAQHRTRISRWLGLTGCRVPPGA